MPYCPACKVALAANAETCPLCNERSVESLSERTHSPVSYSGEVRDADEREKFSPAETRHMVFELLSVSFAIMLIATTGIDILLFPDMAWSLYTGIILVVLWIFTAIPLVLWGRPWLIYAVLGPSLVLAFFLWALFSSGLSWFLFPGLPIVLMSEAAVLATFVLIAIQKRKGLNAVGVILGASVFLCAGIDATVSRFLRGSIILTWSVIVLFSVLPVSAFFFYLHYRVVNRASLRKIFRL